MIATDLIGFRGDSKHMFEILKARSMFNKYKIHTAISQMSAGREAFRALCTCARYVGSNHTDEATFH